VAEVRARLDRAELEPPAVEAAITELCEGGYLDDARYARVFVEDKRALEGWGRERIERGLAQHGISRELIEATLRDEDDLATEHERALELLQRRFPQPRREARERERALGVLVRKGYDSDTAYDVVREWSAGA
jgi:regulatory protein